MGLLDPFVSHEIRVTRTVVWAMVALGYLVFVVLSHDWVSDLYAWIVGHCNRVTLEAWLRVGALGLGVLSVSACLIPSRKRGYVGFRESILWWIMLVVFLVGADWFLIVTNIELIHYPQYAVLAVLFRLAVWDDFFAVFLTTVGGIFDELVQFIWNPQYTKYIDFNDCVLNALGGMLGITLFLIATPQVSRMTAGLRKVKAWVYSITGALVALVIVAEWSGRIIRYSPSDAGFRLVTQAGGKAAFVLSFVRNEGFWTVSEYGRHYHILSMVEALIVLALLLGAFRWFCRRLSRG
ncbi:MAG: hypothetical protein JRI36_13795 [Deltaproteobacteria bacterium]|nr:hypothetical protein [Deltaproteobacteria bacterium]